MRETERQIQIYKEKLPRMKERVFAAVTMLLLAAVMTVSSSMAWLVLSSDPEVKGMNTTITANGNLEIALASGETITKPKETKIGDGALPLVERNLTWGNLVNLGDPAYGLEHIVLRPATLNRNALKESPLYAAGYGSDGRVDGLESDFAYAYWNTDQFSADKNKYGVRTVASVTYGQAPGQNLALADAVKSAEVAIATVQSDFRTLAQSDALQGLVGLMGKYIQAQIDEKLGGQEPIVSISVDEVDSIFYLMTELNVIIEDSAEALAKVYNVEMLRRSDVAYAAANKFTGEYLLTASQTDITAKLAQKNESGENLVNPVMLDELWQLRTDYNQLTADIKEVGTYVGRDDVVYRNLRGSTYPEIETYVNHIVDTGSCTVNGTAIGSLGMSNIGSLTGGGTKPIVLHKGIIPRMDKFTGAEIVTKELSVSVKVFGFTNTAKGQATTSATAPFVLPTEYDNALSGDTSYKGTNPIAGDTFGMALDFFLRTNAPNAHLILQGSPVYETREERATGVVDGEVVELYSATIEITDENGETMTTAVPAYKVGNNDGTVSYIAYDRKSNSTGEVLSPVSEPTALIDEVDYVVGYVGVNRVWDTEGDALLDETSTTQGAGSSYTFYASSPEDQEKSLQLLSHFRIAFISDRGSLLGTASLDTENRFEQYGKVTVPLVLDITNNSVSVNGETVYTITELTRNEATFITALVYLEGEGLTNDQVLAAGEIQGQLNLQFGTTTDLEAMNDPVLKEEKCAVTATMPEPYTVSFDKATQEDMNKTVTVTVEGYTPTTVEAYFLREINSTQGIRQQKLEFSPTEDGKWEGSHQFTSPGKYILREVILDGVTYELNQDPITFTVTGFEITEVFCADNGKTHMLTDKSFDTSVSLTFATDDPEKMPSSVKGAFIHSETGNRTTVYFTRSQGSTWEGSATFTTSGEYVMDYVELNDEYYGLAENQHVNIKLDLGLSVSVYTSETNFALESNETRNQGMSLIIRNDSGDPIKDLTNVWLQYAVGTSSTDENTLGAYMIWNDDRGMYEGTFNIAKAGIYNFRYVSIKLGNETSTLGVATVAPTLTVVSTTVPDFVSKDGFGETFALNNDGAFSITMKDADAATLDAELENENGEIYYVRGIIEDKGDKQTFTFILPIIDGKQSGTWTLNAVYMTNVYGGANNTFFNGSTENGPDVATENKPMYTVSTNYYFRWWKWSLDMLGVTDGVAPSVTVVSNVNVSFTNSDLNANKEFGKTNGTVDGLFGQAYTLGNLEISVTTGSKGKPLSDYGLKVSSVELSYAYDVGELEKVNNSTYRNKYGSYTVEQGAFNNLIEGDAGKKVYSLASSDGSKYTLAPAASNNTLNVAGSYKATSMVVTIVSEDGTGTPLEVVVDNAVLSTAPKYSVSSLKMDAKIDSFAPNKTGYLCSNNAKDDLKNVSSSINAEKTNVKLYCEMQKNGNGFTILTDPYVTLKLFNKAEAGEVKLQFSGDTTRMYEAARGTVNTAYVWSASGGDTCTRYIGRYQQSKTCSSAVVEPAGALTATELTVTLDGVTYMMAIDTITINNPAA